MKWTAAKRTLLRRSRQARSLFTRRDELRFENLRTLHGAEFASNMLTSRTGHGDSGRQRMVHTAITLDSISSENKSIKEVVHKTKTTPRRTLPFSFLSDHALSDESRAEAVTRQDEVQMRRAIL